MPQSTLRRLQSVSSWHLERALLFPLLLLAILFACASPAHAQISPGPLSKAHASLNGTSQCNSCHQFGASTPTYKCLECHKEVAQDRSAKHGYHFQIQMQNPNGKDCVRCHLEHNGENFALIHWEPSEEKFDHRQTGYKLEDKHAPLACEKCHTPAHMIPADHALIKMKDLNKSFFGQSRNCIPCHSDPHKGQLGNECTKCHNVESWRAAKNFDHSKTRYPLTGLHSKVPCEKCHKPDVPGGVPNPRFPPRSCALTITAGSKFRWHPNLASHKVGSQIPKRVPLPLFFYDVPRSFYHSARVGTRHAV